MSRKSKPPEVVMTPDFDAVTDITSEVVIEPADRRITAEMRAAGIERIVELPDDELAAVGDALNAEGARLAAEMGLDDQGNEPALRVVPIEPIAQSVLPDASVAEWRARIDTLEARLATAKQRLAELVVAAEVVEISVLLDHDGAEQAAVEHRDRVHAAEATIEAMARARHRADRELKAAELRESSVERQRRTDRVRVLAGERLPLFRDYDAALAAVERIVRAIHTSTAQLGNYADVSGISMNRLNMRSKFLGAIHANAPTFAKLLDLQRRESLLAYRPATEAEERMWHYFLTGEKAPPPPESVMPAPATGRTLFSEPQLDEPDDNADNADDADADEPHDLPVIVSAEAHPCNFGVLVLHSFSSGGHTYREGETVSAEVVKTWRPANVQAMIRQMRVQPLPAPADGGDLAALMS